MTLELNPPDSSTSATVSPEGMSEEDRQPRPSPSPPRPGNKSEDRSQRRIPRPERRMSPTVTPSWVLPHRTVAPGRQGWYPGGNHQVETGSVPGAIRRPQRARGLDVHLSNWPPSPRNTIWTRYSCLVHVGEVREHKGWRRHPGSVGPTNTGFALSFAGSSTSSQEDTIASQAARRE